MKKLIGAVVIATLLAGCASEGNQQGYYDQQGVYHPAQSAVNADRAQTAAAVGLGVLAAGALAVGISAQHKANKADRNHQDNNNPDWNRQRRYEYNRSRAPYNYGSPHAPYNYGGHRGDFNHPIGGHHHSW